MRGLDEISYLNEHPHAARADDAIFAARSPEVTARQRQAHGERVEARQERGDPFVGFDQAHRGSLAHKRRVMDDLFFGALILGLLASNPVEPDHQERIHSAIDAQPPFFKFWQKLNAKLLEMGKSEAGYGDAKIAFMGGVTPLGAITFIGKEWDGLRAVPSEPVTRLGGNRPFYHGEYREVTELGTVWHKVSGNNGAPIKFALPEAALVAAKDHRAEKINKKFH